MRYGLGIGDKAATIETVVRWKEWLDENYRSLMLWSMAVELLFLAIIVLLDGLLVWKAFHP